MDVRKVNATSTVGVVKEKGWVDVEVCGGGGVGTRRRGGWKLWCGQRNDHLEPRIVINIYFQ